MQETFLLRRAQKGDGRAFEEWVAPYEKGVYLTCLSLTANGEDAKDCVQETMLKAYRGIGRYKGDARPQTWLYRIAYNVCMDLLRKRKPGESFEELSEAGEVFVAEGESPYERLEKKERHERLMSAIRALPEANRSALVLQLQGLSYDEIAGIMNVPEGTVKSRINRAREKIKEMLSKDGELFAFTPVKENVGRQGK